MIANFQEMRAMTSELAFSVWTLAVVGALFESKLADQLREPRSLDELAAPGSTMLRGRIERCLAVAVVAGVVVAEEGRYRLADGAMPFLQPPMRGALQGDVRSHLMQAIHFLDAPLEARGDDAWRHTDRALLEAQGDVSAAFAPAFKMNIAASLGDLAERLGRPGARFLDVGVGVASLAISMCRAFPEIATVGVDSYEVPLAIARERVASAGLAGRIELRQQAVENLTDEASFDLAWLPTFFISPKVLPRAVARVHASLRPGGWLVLPIASGAVDARAGAVLALWTETCGGPVLSIGEAEVMLKEAGFATVRTLPGPPFAPATLAAQA